MLDEVRVRPLREAGYDIVEVKHAIGPPRYRSSVKRSHHTGQRQETLDASTLLLGNQLFKGRPAAASSFLHLESSQQLHFSPNPHTLSPLFHHSSITHDHKMSDLSLYEVVVPTLKKGLQTFDHILNKAEQYAVEKGLDANTVFPEARLIDDQKPLTFQVQNATKTVKVTVGRLTGVESEPWENNEKTFADLHKRIREALDLLETVDAAVVATRTTATVEL